MINISYRHNASGTYVGTWPGKSVRVDGKISKPDQIYLGKVINKEKNIFWTKERGFYTFDPLTRSFGEPKADDIPTSEFKTDLRTRQNPVIVDFGDSFFLDRLVNGIGYGDTLKSFLIKTGTLFMHCFSSTRLKVKQMYMHRAGTVKTMQNIFSQRQIFPASGLVTFFVP